MTRDEISAGITEGIQELVKKVAELTDENIRLKVPHPHDKQDAQRYRLLRDQHAGEHAVINGELLEGAPLDTLLDERLKTGACGCTANCLKAEGMDNMGYCMAEVNGFVRPKKG